MASTVTKTVKSAGGDYSSLSGFEAGEQADITLATGNDTIVKAECYSFSDTAKCRLDGWTTAAGNYIEAFTPTAERHDGKYNSSKYRLEVSNDHCLDIRENYVRADGLQFALSNPTAIDRSNILLFGVGASSDVRISNCVGKGHADATYSENGIYCLASDATITIWNCVLYGRNALSGTRGIRLDCSAGNIYNCTIKSGDYGIGRESGTVIVKNTAILDCTDDFNGTFNTIDYCASDDGNGTNAQTLDATNDYENEFVDVTTGDFHLISYGVCIGNGVDDPGSGLYSDDIDGEARTSTWDIGADEFVSAEVTKTKLITGKLLLSKVKTKLIEGKLILAKIIQKTLAGNFLISRQKSTTLGGKLLLSQDKTKTLEGKLLLSKAKTKVIDGKLLLSQQKTKTVEGKLLLAQSKTKTLSGKLHLSSAKTKTLSGKLLLSEQKTKTLSGSLLLSDTFSKTISGGLYLDGAKTKTISGKLYLSRPSVNIKYDLQNQGKRPTVALGTGRYTTSIGNTRKYTTSTTTKRS